MALRATSFLASPLVWLAAVTMLATGRIRLVAVYAVLAAVVQLLKLAAGAVPSFNLLAYVPQFPGRLGGLIRNDLRELLSVLDIYVALVLSAGATAYRVFGVNQDPQAPVVLSLLIGIAVSTSAQCLFGLDLSGSALTRYRLMPVRGWQVLLSKDIAYLAILTLLVLPLNPVSGWTFGLTALAIGHWPSVMMRAPVHRWRFTGSRLFPGVVQAVIALILGFGGQWAIAAVLYVLSLAFLGRCWKDAVMEALPEFHDAG